MHPSLMGLEDEVNPLPLGVGDVLDQSNETEFADGCALCRLLVAESAHGIAQEEAVPVE
jgi:hypothetical protein